MVRIVDETVRAAAAITNEDAIEGAASTTAADYGSGNCIPVDITPVGTLPLDAQHGKSWDGDTAFCRQTTGGLVNCQACLLEAQRALARATAREGAELANRILDELYLASSEGLEKTRILVSWCHIITAAYTDRCPFSKSCHSNKAMLLAQL